MRSSCSPCAVLLIAFAASLLAGCASPFKQFYEGTTATIANEEEPVVVTESTPPTVLTSSNLSRDIEACLQQGMVMLGQASWYGADVGTESQAREQAKLVGASLVLWSWQHAGSSSGVMPLTMPSTTTTYGGGTVYGNYGSATWTGSATTYGTTTTYIPYTVHQYNVGAAFLARRTKPPTLGVYPRPMSSEDQAAAGTISGLYIVLVITGSPAAKSGILPADVLCKIGGDAIDSYDGFEAALAKHAGTTVEVELRRRGERLTYSIPLNPR